MYLWNNLVALKDKESVLEFATGFSLFGSSGCFAWHFAWENIGREVCWHACRFQRVLSSHTSVSLITGEGDLNSFPFPG